MNHCLDSLERQLKNERNSLVFSSCKSLEPIHQQRFHAELSIKKGLNIGYKPMKEAFDALKSDKNLEVILKQNEIIFQPKENKPSTGILFFAGGLVDKRSYAPLARRLAKEGYLVILSDADMATTLKNQSGKAMNENNHIGKWYLGGHSQGGVVATEIARYNPSKVEGVILLASYPIFNFKQSPIKFLDIRAEFDKVLPKAVADVSFRMTVAEKNLSKVVISGGNHGNFGYYGEQLFDGKAAISRDAQQNVTFSNIIEFIKKGS